VSRTRRDAVRPSVRRSPRSAVLVNLVSLGATFGFLVLFWQEGHGSNLIYGVPATGSIRN